MNPFFKTLLFTISLSSAVALAGTRAPTGERIIIDSQNRPVKIIDTFDQEVLTDRGIYKSSDLTSEVSELEGYSQGRVVLAPDGFRRIIRRVFADGRVSLYMFLTGTVVPSHYVPIAEEIFPGTIRDLKLSSGCTELMLPPFRSVPAGSPPLRDPVFLREP